MKASLQKLVTAIAIIILSVFISFLSVPTSMAATRNSIPISQVEFGDSWPFTVASGELYCIGTGTGSHLGAVVLATEDESYAVNGTASALGYKEIDEIWRDDPEIAGLKINIAPIIERGLKICK